MKIILTGADGQLGRCFLEESKQFRQLNIHPYSKADLDITDEKAVRKICKTEQFGLWINCAAYTNVDGAEGQSKLAFKINKSGTENIARVCNENDIFLIHFSSDYVYHNNLRRPLLETDLLDPKGVYAKSKLAGEVAVCRFSEHYIIFRTSWVYSKYGHNFMKTMLRIGKNNQAVNVVDDQIGSPTSAHTLAVTILNLIQAHGLDELKANQGMFNISNKGSTSWAEFAELIYRMAKAEVKVEKVSSKDFGSKAERPEYSVMSNEKLDKTFSISLPSWEKSLEDCIKAYLSSN